MKKLIILLLTLTLILGIFASCNSKRYLPVDDETSSSPSKVMTTEDNQGFTTSIIDDKSRLTSETVFDSVYMENYTIKEIDDKYYIVFNSYDVDTNSLDKYRNTFLTFYSVEEFLDTLLNNKLDLNDMAYIAKHFDKTANGIPIFDPYNFYVPSMPEPWTLSKEDDLPALTILNGLHYKFTATYNGETPNITVDIFSKELYEEIYSKEESAFTAIQNDQKTILMYYEINSDSKYMVTMYISEANLYYKYTIGYLDNIPSDDYLLSFGIQKYEG